MIKLKRYRVFFMNGNDICIDAESASYSYYENAKKTFLVYTIGSKVIATFNADNICGDIVIDEYSEKDITGRGI